MYEQYSTYLDSYDILQRGKKKEDTLVSDLI